MEEVRSNANPVQLKTLDDGGVLGPARQRFDPKHQVVLQCRIPWQAAKVVPEPRPTNLGPLRALSLTQRLWAKTWAILLCNVMAFVVVLSP
jgi:hypothetical protein